MPHGSAYASSYLPAYFKLTDFNDKEPRSDKNDIAEALQLADQMYHQQIPKRRTREPIMMMDVAALPSKGIFLPNSFEKDHQKHHGSNMNYPVQAESQDFNLDEYTGTTEEHQQLTGNIYNRFNQSNPGHFNPNTPETQLRMMHHLKNGHIYGDMRKQRMPNMVRNIHYVFSHTTANCS